MSPKIRRATIADQNTITTFNIQIAHETEDVKLDPKIASEGVAALLTDPAKGRYFVLEEDGRIAAQLMITFEWSDWRNGQMWWIQSVYVHSDYRRRGFFRALYEHVVQQAKEESAVGIRLYVDTHNTKAQETRRDAHGLLDIVSRAQFFCTGLLCLDGKENQKRYPWYILTYKYKAMGMSTHYLVFEDVWS